MKRIVSSLCLLLVLLLTLAAPIYAADTGRTFAFDLSVDGGAEKSAAVGDEITVTFTLRRTDSAEEYTMYAMQNEIVYDPTFYQLVDGSVMATSGVQTKDLGLRDGNHSLYMNFVSLIGGETWKADTVVGSFRLKIIGTTGSSAIRSTNCFVSTQDGTEQYAATQQDVTVSVSGYRCVVRFETNGGSAVPEQTVAMGGRVKKPTDPTREGYVLEGWYSDMDLQNEWNFDKDTVSGNMTLYAKWEAPRQLPLLWLLLALIVVIVVLVILGRRHARRKENTKDINADSSIEREKEETTT